MADSARLTCAANDPHTLLHALSKLCGRSPGTTAGVFSVGDGGGGCFFFVGWVPVGTVNWYAVINVHGKKCARLVYLQMSMDEWPQNSPSLDILN